LHRSVSERWLQENNSSQHSDQVLVDCCQEKRRFILLSLRNHKNKFRRREIGSNEEISEDQKSIAICLVKTDLKGIEENKLTNEHWR